MNCYTHTDREAIGVCVSCGKPVCGECKVELGGKFYCNPCADRIFTSNIEAGANTSGQGSAAVVPSEVLGWNWGAFFLSWIWGIGNKVWISFLVFIPYFDLIWIFVLGAKGNEWAWRSKRWDSIEHFKQTQRSWAKWGLILFVLNIALAVGLILLVAAIFATNSVSSFKF